MKFYIIHEGFYEGVQARIDLLKSACVKMGLKVFCVDSLDFDYSKLPKLSKQDLLYNISSGSQTLVSLLLNDEVTTFYKKNPNLNLITSTTEWTIIHTKAKLPQPKTIFHLTKNRVILKAYIDFLGGFPLIIKSPGGSRGIGTIKIETWQNLISTVDYLVTTPDSFIMREFIHADYGARVIVLGNEVILSKKFYFQENDFRNAPILSATHYEPMEIDEPTKQLCIKAVHLANLEMAGVDLLFERETGKPYLLEINFPTGFQSFMDDPQPVLTKMIQHLINKANRYE
ncbi:ATP-grasp domain-containing protein [Mucilaginibacter dorajii]|uniref:ATP-grasp domain-containing protein n=1 Tax=Mucilaginibacter dorajii TaxID=692994 RepID=A0ABP7QBN7_9SPHI|nr:hypothetical protein [Mucilaginibacter dorajii]MCS3733108.1 hypothetical protein [Mucilaginibacter dorajii]